MKAFRFIFLICILLAGIGLIVLFILEQVTTPLKSTLVPFYQVIGITTKSVDRVFSRIIPVNDLDEAKMGNYFASYYSFETNPGDPGQVYVESLLKKLIPFVQKPFPYRVYVISDTSPNAFALPGGVILVTRGLLNIMKTDGEVTAILAHEIGHIELSHCFDAVKFERLATKMGNKTLGEILDFTFRLLLRHSFSKTEENEADEYAFDLLLQTRYDPSAMGRAFGRLLSYEAGSSYSPRTGEKAGIIKDYFRSHPRLATRKEKFEQEAKVWRMLHPKEQRDM